MLMRSVQVLGALFDEFGRQGEGYAKPGVRAAYLLGTPLQLVLLAAPDTVKLSVVDPEGDFGKKGDVIVSVHYEHPNVIEIRKFPLQGLNEARHPELRRLFFRMALLYSTCSDYNLECAPDSRITRRDLASSRTLN
jgi:hypothetical protein